MTIIPIPALSDNYIWMMEENGRAVVVDPGEGAGVLEILREKGWVLEGIFLTHKHPDHIGGVGEILEAFPVAVYGPEETGVATEIVSGDEAISALGGTFDVLATPGHTEGHVAFFRDGHLFSGDTLFLSSCGRVFSGDYEAMFDTLQRLKALDDNVKVYAAHEYSLSNLEQSVNYLDDEAIRKELDRVRKLRERGEVSLPTTIGKEKEVNPFFVIDDLEAFKRYRKFRGG